MTPPKENSNYYPSESNDIGLENLGEFLSDVCRVEAISDVINDLYGNQYKLGGSNRTIIDQYDDYLEIRSTSYDRDEVKYYEDLPCLRISIDEFARILREWRDFLELGGKEFLITQEDDDKLVITKTYKDYNT
ncbi:MAG: hypothetical protein M1114_02610 [Candidatus Dependentiae bacterium]|nr:hypothetical protein [Candidatus Dependentiae bacterium]